MRPPLLMPVRPLTAMKLDEVAGNARARAVLARAVAENHPSHAYLLTGPTGVGKTTMALAFADALLQAAGSPPAKGLHPDLWVEDSDAESISIETIRRDGRVGRGDPGEPRPGEPAQPLQAFLSLKGMHSDRRVAILARAERLKETAASPLLKTIEEPPAGAVLVLCAEASDLLPATVRSRCQELEFKPLTDAEMAAFVAARGLEVSADVLQVARGCPGELVRLAVEPEEAVRRLAWPSTLDGIAGGSWLEIVSLGARFGTSDSARNRALAREALEAWEWWLRDLAVAAAPPDLPLGSLPPTAVLDLWESVREAADRVRNNVNPRLAIEVFLADVQRAAAA